MSSTKTGRLPFIVRRFVQRSPTSDGRGQLEQVGQHRLLVVEMEHGVPDHGRIVPGRASPGDDPMVRVYGW